MVVLLNAFLGRILTLNFRLNVLMPAVTGTPGYCSKTYDVVTIYSPSNF